MKRPDLAALNAFLAVAEAQSFVRAATRLGVARSTLSETGRQLEERLGVRLLNRTTRSVALTQAGEQLLQRLRPVLDDLAAAFESLNAFRDRPSGSLRLTVAPPAAHAVWGRSSRDFSLPIPRYASRSHSIRAWSTS